ncbi:deoxyuridine 5'-triphosphate nucleotidohydrolase [Erwinia phage Fougasse]|nr:deoxyuridine 5'-triphosphate nucleotidohydrolase [Erwinia phage Berlingot]WJN63996.1 deoxyuridine 5'-triphosphate nucleotidohydrolase [Erwinia phage Fougasse]WJN64064.1 deoxyuridine 5'-triphosphate nucleotidohydrolase [Erwinia phage Mauresque]WJN64142.1 deoxyuridine 5'-triphosphate nucleotidohydrolase [Erwinia phage Navette]WJN64229.1 deoxyuridine 5'-triphosphate nucleotidohydrolase [Erwinia phage Nougat]
MCPNKVPHVNFLLCHPSASLPFYASRGSAAADISSTDTANIAPGSTAIVGTGLKPEIPEGYVALIYSRSGHGFKNDIRLANCVGVIDSDYRGEIKVKLTNDGNSSFEVQPGDRVAQMMIVPAIQATFEVQENLTSTVRGEGGFGSTGNA